jgi:hypothetical protein
VTVAWVAVGLGAVLAFIQSLQLFVLSDLRDRIMRLESQKMQSAPAGD